MPTCKNPECRKEIGDDREYCGEECLRHALELNRMKKESIDPSVEAVLEYIGIVKTNFTKNVAYRHWEHFIEFVRKNSGKSWGNFIKPRLRSYIGIDYRYLEAFLESCLSWGVIELKDGNLYFLGLPKEENENATQ